MEDKRRNLCRPETSLVDPDYSAFLKTCHVSKKSSKTFTLSLKKNINMSIEKTFLEAG
jgi:hypothetical protein